MSTHCSYLPSPSGATENKCSPFHVATEETQFLSRFWGRYTHCRVRERRGTRESLWPSLPLSEPMSGEARSRQVCKVTQERWLELRTSAPHFCWREPWGCLQEVGPHSQA